MNHITTHWVTCLSIALNLANVAWSLHRGWWGMAIYWLAAAQITFAATWLTTWGK